jgi:hypothetical protein
MRISRYYRQKVKLKQMTFFLSKPVFNQRHLSLIYKNPRSRFMLELMINFVSILKFETRCSNLSAWLWVVGRSTKNWQKVSVAFVLVNFMPGMSILKTI